MTSVYKKKDLKEFDLNNQIYILDPLDLELYHIYSPLDIERLYESVIMPKRNSVKISSSYNFGKSSRKIDVVSLDISHGCTLKCSYCYLSAGYHKKEMMSKERFLEILKFLAKNNSGNVTFYFAGEGEPTLNFNLLKQIPKLCKEFGFENSHFEITTNGTLLSSSVIKFFEEEKFTVAISLDGDKENDSKRVFLNNTPSFPLVIKNILTLKKTRIKFACKATIMPENKNIVQMFTFFEDNEIPFYHGFATRAFNDSYLPQIEDVNNNLKQQFSLLVDYYVSRIKNNKYVYARKLIEDIRRIQCKTTSYTGCSAGINSFYFNLKGDIYVCSSHNSCKELCVGNIHNGIDYEKIDKHNFYPKEVDRYEKCKDCWLRHLCSGSCIAAKWLESKDTTIPSAYHCALNKVYWEAIIRIFIQIQPYIKNNVNFEG